MATIRFCAFAAMVAATGFFGFAVCTNPIKAADTHDANTRLCALLFLSALSGR